MAVGAITLYSNAVLEMGDGSFDFNADTYVMTLISSGYTPAPNTDKLWSDVSANELATALGYTAGGEVLSGVAWTLTSATGKYTFTAPTWPAFSATFKYGVIVRRAGGSLVSGDHLLAYFDANTSGTYTGSGGTFTITPNSSGIFTATHSP